MSLSRPLIAHVIYRLNVGGLENGLVNLINNLTCEKYTHAVICLTESSDFSRRIQKNDVKIYELKKKDGNDIGLYFRLFRLLREIKPVIVHSRNLAALEASIVAMLAGVPIRVHGEHGRDIYDLHGKNSRYRMLRRFCNFFIDKFVCMSKDLQNWLIQDVGINSDKVLQLYNGVDHHRFEAIGKGQSRYEALPEGFFSDDKIIIGTVGRLEPVKDQMNLVEGFIRLMTEHPELHGHVRLILIGTGSLLPEIQKMLANAGLNPYAWLPGNRNDVPELLRLLDIFVLPSLGEGISNTILEAMASGLPVIATRVGGNTELVEEAKSGILVPPSDASAIAKALKYYIDHPDVRAQHGTYARKRVEVDFSLEGMMHRYEMLYDQLINEKYQVKQ